jgi:hypothetical protein
VFGCFQQNLESGQTLLAIDHLSPGQASCCCRLLFKNDGAKEMAGHRGVTLAGFQPTQDTHDVIPKWLPLILPCPDIGALEERNGEAFVAGEKPCDLDVVRLHALFPFSFGPSYFCIPRIAVALRERHGPFLLRFRGARRRS